MIEVSADLDGKCVHGVDLFEFDCATCEQAEKDAIEKSRKRQIDIEELARQLYIQNHEILTARMSFSAADAFYEELDRRKAADCSGLVPVCSGDCSDPKPTSKPDQMKPTSSNCSETKG